MLSKNSQEWTALRDVASRGPSRGFRGVFAAGNQVEEKLSAHTAPKVVQLKLPFSIYAPSLVKSTNLAPVLHLLPQIERA